MFVSVGILFARPAACGENWTSYRGPTDQGLSDAARLPLHWSESENVVWKTPIDGKAWSSPVIWGDRIWLTTASEDGTELVAISIDKNSGKILINKPLRHVAGPQYCIPFNSYASPSPVIEEGRVYVSFGSPCNACLDSNTGEVIWERNDFVCNHFRGAGSSPMLAALRLYGSHWIRMAVTIASSGLTPGFTCGTGYHGFLECEPSFLAAQAGNWTPD